MQVPVYWKEQLGNHYSDLNVSELNFGNRSLNFTVAFTSLSSSNVYNCDCRSSMLKRDSRISGVATSLIAIL